MPELKPRSLPTGADWAPAIAAEADENLARTRAIVDQLKDGSARNAAAVLGLWNDADLALRNAGAITSVLAEVHPDEAVRTLAEGKQQDVQRLRTELGLDRDLYEALAGVDATELDADEARLLELTLRDFRRSGVDQSDEVRERLRELADRAVVVGQDFSRNIRDDVRSI